MFNYNFVRMKKVVALPIVVESVYDLEKKNLKVVLFRHTNGEVVASCDEFSDVGDVLSGILDSIVKNLKIVDNQ